MLDEIFKDFSKTQIKQMNDQMITKFEEKILHGCRENMGFSLLKGYLKKAK